MTLQTTNRVGKPGYFTANVWTAHRHDARTPTGSKANNDFAPYSLENGLSNCVITAGKQIVGCAKVGWRMALLSISPFVVDAV